MIDDEVMYRVISTRTHGAIDYAWASLAAGAPTMIDASSTTARIVRNAGAATGLMSMMTNYEAGVVRLMPMRVHLALDFLIGAALFLSPLMLPKGERRFALVPVTLGAVGILASVLTEKDPEAPSGTFTPSYELSEAVADPDIARRPHLRSHLE